MIGPHQSAPFDLTAGAWERCGSRWVAEVSAMLADKATTRSDFATALAVTYGLGWVYTGPDGSDHSSLDEALKAWRLALGY